jgi:hypothetical protein
MLKGVGTGGGGGKVVEWRVVEVSFDDQVWVV